MASRSSMPQKFTHTCAAGVSTFCPAAKASGCFALTVRLGLPSPISRKPEISLHHLLTFGHRSLSGFLSRRSGYVGRQAHRQHSSGRGCVDRTQDANRRRDRRGRRRIRCAGSDGRRTGAPSRLASAHRICPRVSIRSPGDSRAASGITQAHVRSWGHSGHGPKGRVLRLLTRTV